MGKSKIEWTDKTWNPVTGCVKVSPGCKHCYAESMSLRLQKMGAKKYKDAFTPSLHPDVLDEPSRWKEPARIFVCSMSDLFQDAVNFSFVHCVMNEIRRNPHHEFQILTKRAERMFSFFCDKRYAAYPCPGHCWLGVSVEDQDRLYRAEWLVQIPAAVRFLSVEPMLGPVKDIPKGVNWVICGGESGPKSRPMDPDWARALRDECVEKNIPFFFKQWGGRNKKAAGRELDGRTWDEMPI